MSAEPTPNPFDPQPVRPPTRESDHAHGIRYTKTTWIDPRTGELRGGCLHAPTWTGAPVTAESSTAPKENR